jgi:hypothetical protein
VVGTRFVVRRDDGSIHVEVERGIVLVRSERLPGGSVRLTAGQDVLVTESARASTALGAPSIASAAPAVALSALPVTPASNPSAATQGPDAVDRELATADSARRRGDRPAAVQALEAALAAAGPNDQRRGLVALSLARLVLTTDPRTAAEVLRDSFHAMPAGLLEDALARRVEAEGRAGNFVEASRLATQYERSYPSGRRLSEVRRWSAP